jgi:hypothetical protein
MELGRINALLGVLVALLALAVWFSPAPPGAARLTELEPASVTRLRIQRPGEAELAYRRADQGWQPASPTAPPLGDTPLDRLTEIAAAHPWRRLDAPPDLAALGLAPPGLVLMLDDTRLELGGTEPLRGRRYVRTAAGVFLIDDRYLHLAPRPLAAPTPGP